MPEGDSVFRLAARLRAALDGRVLTGSDFRVPQLATTDLAGRRIVAHETHGKHLLTRFDAGPALHTHLRLDGSWTLLGPGRALPRRVVPDVRFVLSLEDGGRAVGVAVPVVELLDAEGERRVLGHLGPDPLRGDWDAGRAVSRIARTPGRPVIEALRDQGGMAGLGNLWANELCFLRGVHPDRAVAAVDLEPLVALAARALRHSATDPRAYQVTTGDLRRGRQHWVTGRASKPCLRCGTLVRARGEHPGRTYWCPRCQPE